MPVVSDMMRHVHDLLASMLGYAASTQSFWYNINGNTSIGLLTV